MDRALVREPHHADRERDGDEDECGGERGAEARDGERGREPRAQARTQRLTCLLGRAVLRGDARRDALPELRRDFYVALIAQQEFLLALKLVEARGARRTHAEVRGDRAALIFVQLAVEIIFEGG